MNYLPYIIWGILILLVILLWKRLLSLGIGGLVVIGVFLLIGFIFSNINTPVSPDHLGLGFFATGYHKTLDDPKKTGDHLIKGATKAGESAVNTINSAGTSKKSASAKKTSSKITGVSGLTDTANTPDLQQRGMPLTKVPDYLREHKGVLTKHDGQLLSGANAGLTTTVKGDHISYRVTGNKINIQRK